jgi:GntR family transcriptional regulator
MPRQKHQSSEEMLQMLSSIDIHSSVAVYLQIENHVQFAITAKRLSAGDQLPSVRELSERLDVNPNTVAKAYRDLEVMGLLFTRRGKGVFVKAGVESRCREECLNRIAARMHEVMVEARVAGISNELAAEIVSASLASDSSPYGATPASVLKLVKKATKKS